MVRIEEVKTKKQMKKFVEFPLKLYENCPYYVPQFYGDEMRLFFPEKNVHSEYSKTRFFLAYKGDEVAGRIAGIIVYPYIEKTGRKVMRFSRFDLIDDEEVARALFKAVEDFAREEGLDEIQGPMGYNDTDREGLLIEGFDKMSTYAENYSYDYYPRLVEQNGFVKEVDWLEYKIFLPEKPDERLKKMSQLVAKRFNLRDVTKSDLSMSKIIDKYGHKVFDLVNIAYAPLHGTIPLKGKVVDEIIGVFKLFLTKDFVSVIVDENDNVVAFAAVLASIVEELQRSKGKLSPLSIFRLLKLKNNPKAVEFALIAILPEYQKKGLTAMMMDKILHGLIARNIKYAETNLELEYNSNVLSLWEGVNKEFLKRRRCYVKKIEL